MSSSPGVIAAVVVTMIAFCIVPPSVISSVAPVQSSQAWKNARSPSAPPPFVFPIVWFTLYLLAAAALSLQLLMPNPAASGGVRYTALGLLLAQLIIGYAWPLVWNTGNSYGSSFMILAMLALTIPGVVLALRTNLIAGCLWTPLIAWLVFALMLSAQTTAIQDSQKVRNGV